MHLLMFCESFVCITLYVALYVALSPLVLLWTAFWGSLARSQDGFEEECINPDLNFCCGAGGDPHLYKDGRHVICGCNGYLTYINNRLITITARHSAGSDRNPRRVTPQDYTTITEVAVSDNKGKSSCRMG